MSSTVPIQGSPSVSLTTRNGDITVVRGDDPTMSIVATIRARNEARLGATEIMTSLEADGSYSVSIAWPDDKRLNNEGAEFFVTLPAASELKLQSSNGAFTIENLDAAVHARTSNGSIRILGSAQSVDAVTSNGTIDLEGTVGPVDARSSNGWIRLMLAPENSGPVVLTTSNGGLTLGIGPAFNSELELSTSNGGLNVEGFSEQYAPVFYESSRNYLRLGFSDSIHQSSLQTSNGTVTVRPL
jgi:DUF4097 and DUF4098 domain-containing protein YvlB